MSLRRGVSHEHPPEADLDFENGFGQVNSRAAFQDSPPVRPKVATGFEELEESEASP